MAKIDAKQFASTMALGLNTDDASVKEVTGANTLPSMVSRYYGTTYESLKDKYSTYKNWSPQLYAESAKRGELDTYFSLIEQTKDATLDPRFFDDYYDYEVRLLELYKNVADDEEKTERTVKVFDPQNNTYVDKNIGNLTDKEFIQYQLDQEYTYFDEKIQYELEKYQKSSMSGWEKFGHTVGQVLSEFGEGVLSMGAGILDAFAAPVYATALAIDGQRWDEAFTDYYANNSLTALEKEGIRAELDEWERRYGWIRNIDGSTTSVGGAIAGIANSFGMMIPAIAINMVAPGAGFGTFYLGTFSNNMYENAVNGDLKGPAWIKILNAGLKSGAEAAIEWGLGKLMGSTISNTLIGVKGAAIDAGAKSLASIAAGKSAGAILSTIGKTALQEGLEEFLQDLGTGCIDAWFNLIYDGYSDGIDFQQLVDSFIIGAASSLILANTSVAFDGAMSKIYQRQGKVYGRDIFYTRDGKTEKVEGYSRLVWREALNNFNENIETLRKHIDAGKISNSDVNNARSAYAVYTVLGEFFDSISQERIEKAKLLLDRFVLESDETNNITNKSLREFAKREFAIDYDENLSDAQLKYLVDTNGMEIEYLDEFVSKISDDIDEAFAKSKFDATAQTAVKKAVIDATKRNAKKLYDGEVKGIERIIDKNGDTIGSNEKMSKSSLEKFRAKQNRADAVIEDAWKASQKTVDGLKSEYDFIFTTDGKVAIEDGKFLFVPEAWLQNHSDTEIKNFLEESKIIDTILADDVWKPIIDIMRESYKEFTGVNNELITDERVLLDTLFNESVYQHFLLNNIHNKKIYSDTGINYVLLLGEVIKELGNRTNISSERKNLLDKIYARIKNTMRIPTLKAIINWNIDPQSIGANLVLNETDMKFVNGYFARKGRLAGEDVSEFYNLREKIMQSPYMGENLKSIIEKGSLENASKKDRLLAHLALDCVDQRLYNKALDMAERNALDHIDRSLMYLSDIKPDGYDSDVYHAMKKMFKVIDLDNVIRNKYINPRIKKFVKSTLQFVINTYAYVYWNMTDVDYESFLLKLVNDDNIDYAVRKFVDSTLLDDEGNATSTPLDPETHEPLFNNKKSTKELNEFIARSVEAIRQRIKGFYTTDTSSSKTFGIPIEAFHDNLSLADIQYVEDIRKKFVNDFGIEAETLFNINDVIDVKTLKQEYPNINISALGIDDTLETSVSQFTLDKLNSMLGDSYSAVRGTDGELKYIKNIPAEILFNKSALYDYLEDFFDKNNTCFVGDLLNENLLKILPESIRSAKIFVDHSLPVGDAGYYDPDYNKIVIKEANDRITLYHEINHLIQNQYSLPGGGDPDALSFEFDYLNEIFQVTKPLMVALAKEAYYDDQKTIEHIENANNIDDLINVDNGNELRRRVSYLAYFALHGEIEARYYGHNGKLPNGYVIDKDLQIYSPITGAIFNTDLTVNFEDDVYNIAPSNKLAHSSIYIENKEIESFIRMLEEYDEDFFGEASGDNYHSALTHDVRVVLDDILNPNLGYMRYAATIDGIIKNPDVYLSKNLLAKIKDKSEGGVYRFLQNYLYDKNYGINIDRDISHKYVFVDDNAFNDIQTKRTADAANDLSNNDFVKDNISETGVSINYFYDSKVLTAMGIPTDIKVVINNDVKYNETVFNDKHKNGIIYLHVDDLTTNGDLVKYINHEFRHVLQHYNRLESGFTPDFEVTNELMNDMKKHYPKLFTDERIKLWINNDVNLVQRFIYYMVGGEQNAHAFSYWALAGKPWYVSHEAGSIFIFAPWYDGTNGVYKTKALANRAEEKSSKKRILETKKEIIDGKEVTVKVLPPKAPRKRTIGGKREEKLKFGSDEEKGNGLKNILPEKSKPKANKVKIAEDKFKYEYSRKGWYLSKERAEKSNLKYFYKSGGDNQMAPEMQDFIEATTGNESKLPKGLVLAIQKGKLNKNELMRWFRSVDFNDETQFNDYTFDLLNKYIFKNTKITTKEQLEAMTNEDVRTWFGALLVFQRSGASIEWLLKENSVEGFVNFMNALENSSWKEKIENASKQFERLFVTDTSGAKHEIEMTEDTIKYMRVLTMLEFDGTLLSAMKIASMFVNFQKKYYDKTFGLSGKTSLDAPIEGNNKSAGHGGESTEGTGLENILDESKVELGGQKNPFTNIISELYLENSRGATTEEIINTLAEYDFNKKAKDQAEKLLKVINSKTDKNKKLQAYKELLSVYKSSLSGYYKNLLKIEYEDMKNSAKLSFAEVEDSIDEHKKEYRDELVKKTKIFEKYLEEYIKSNKGADVILLLLKDAIVSMRKSIYSMLDSIDLNARYDTYVANTFIGDESVEIDTSNDIGFSRRNYQQYVKSLGTQISNRIASGDIVWSLLPKDVRDMFIREELGEGRTKAIRYILKEEYYKVGRGRAKKGSVEKDSYIHDYTGLKETGTKLNDVLASAKLGAYLKTENGKTIRENIRALEQKNAKRTREQKKTESHLAETVFNYKKQVRGTKSEKTNKNLARKIETSTSIFSRQELPMVLRNLFGTAFESFADTEVQFASKDADGKLYEKDDKTFESRLKHEILSWDKFYEVNRQILNDIGREDVLDIVEAIQLGIWSDLDGKRKLDAFQVFTMGYIADGARRNIRGWNLSDAEIEVIESTYEKLASAAGSGLNAVKQMISTVNPVKKVQQEMFSEYGITEDDTEELFTAIENYVNTNDRGAKSNFAQIITREVGRIEGLMQENFDAEIASKKDKAARKTKRKEALADYNRRMEQYNADLADYKQHIEENNGHRIHGLKRPVRPEKPSILKDSVFTNRNYEKLMSYRYMAMLSNPMTWLRNLTSNIALSRLNAASDKLGNVVFTLFGKKDYREDQYDLSKHTKVSNEVNAFADELLNDIIYNDGKKGQKLFDLLYDETSKYTERNKLTSTSDMFITMVTHSIENKFAAAHRFDSKQMNRVNGFIRKKIGDKSFVKRAANKYFKKMLQIEMEQGNIDLAEGVNMKVLNLFAEAVILGNQEYMHKPSFLGDMINSLRDTHPVAYETLRLFQPFINSSFNWFGEMLKYTPLGLVRAIKNSVLLEKAITKAENKRNDYRFYAAPTSKATEFLIRRDLGKGLIGTLFIGIGMLLGAFGVLKIDDDDDNIYISIGDIKIDITNIFGTSSILVGAALASKAPIEDILTEIADIYTEGFILKDIYEKQRWSNGMYESLLIETESVLKSFVPQFVQLFIRATNNYSISYSSGMKGMFERYINSFIPTQPLGTIKINPYTGEKETKYAIPFVGELLKSGILGAKIYWKSISDEENLAKEYSVNKLEIENEITINGQKISIGDKITLNEYYGSLNKNSLSNVKNKSHLVKMADGSFKTLDWDEMTDTQRTNVIEKIFTTNANYAKIYMWTQVLGNKYYTNQSTKNTLKELGITSNIFLGDKGFVE